MMYLGDFNTGATVYCPFNTSAASGASVAFSNALEAGDITVYKDGSATQRTSTAGFTVTSAFDSLVGVHMIAIDLSDNTDAGFYAAGHDYHIVLAPDTETVDSLVVNGALATFSILNRSALRPTTAGRTLDIAADGSLDTDSLTAIQTAIRTDPRTGYKGTGTAAGGSANTIILASGAGAALAVKAGDIIVVNADGVYDVQTVASISTDTCTMDGNWSVNAPDNNDVYDIYGGGTGLTTTALAAAYLTVNVKKVNDVTLQGAGTSGDKWRPA